jgi:CheY-like chemotaxis protein
VTPQVLYIDDAASNLFVVELIAQDQGIKLETAATGTEGLKKIADKKYDLILSDIRLPDVSGYDILKEAREGSLNRYTPIIAFTADVTVTTREKIIDHGFTDYLTKPFNNEDLVRKLSAYLSVEEMTPDLSYYTAYAKEEAQIIKAKAIILSDFKNFDKNFFLAWISRNGQELENQLHKIEFVCQNLRLVRLVELIKEFRSQADSFPDRELTFMMIKKNILSIYRSLA